MMLKIINFYAFYNILYVLYILTLYNNIVLLWWTLLKEINRPDAMVDAAYYNTIMYLTFSKHCISSVQSDIFNSKHSSFQISKYMLHNFKRLKNYIFYTFSYKTTYILHYLS